MLIAILDRFLRVPRFRDRLGEAGTLRIFADQIRVPDVAFLSWRHFPGRVLPQEPVPCNCARPAVEVLSKGNTKREMERKLKDYFAAGVKLVWFIDPLSKSATVHEDPQTTAQF